MLTTIVGVGLVLAMTYFLLSTIASAINEAIAAVRASRAKRLKAAIYGLLVTGSGMSKNDGLAGAVYGHALVGGLKPGSKPSYVPTRNFTEALLSVLGDRSSLSTDDRFKAIFEVVAQLPADGAGSGLKALVASAGGNIDELRRGIDGWFDSSMERVSGDYKRRSQLSLFLIGLILAVILNVDTSQIVRTLYLSEARLKIAVDAATAAQPSLDAPTPPTDAAGQPTKATAPPTAPADQPTDPDAKPPDTAADLASLQDQIDARLALLDRMQLPIGWTACGAGPCADASSLTATALLSALPGWLLTAIAISFGAPFWFDLLNRFANLRSTGRKPDSPSPRSSVP